LVAIVSAKDYPVLSRDIINRVNSMNGVSWVAGENEIFKGKSLSQIRRLFGALLVDPRTDNRPRHVQNVRNAMLPKEFDSRTQWPKCIHAIRDQGNCGSCWAFSSSEAMSDRMCIATQGKVNEVLSPQDLVSCDTGDYGCEGGYMDVMWEYIANHGIVSEKCFPYKSYSGESVDCPFGEGVNKCTESGVEFKKYFAVKEPINFIGNVETAMNEIATNGPITTGFRVYQDFFSYKKGVYHHVSGGFAGGHAVKVVGWGHDSVSNKDYWIIANSWSNSWGMDGFFWIQKGNDECGCETQMITGHADLSRL